MVGHAPGTGLDSGGPARGPRLRGMRETARQMKVDRQARARIRRGLSLWAMATGGFWWCAGCQAVTEVNCDGVVNVCAVCGSGRVRFTAPVIQEKPTGRGV